MRQKLFYLSALCTVCSVLQAQTTSSTGQPGDQYSPSGNSSYSSQGWENKRFGATGRMGQHEIRASKILGTELKNATGETLGTIQDVILNPASGRIEFAVASLQSKAGANTSAATGITSSATGQLVPIPWTLIRPSGVTGYGARSTAGTSASEEQPVFVFTGDTAKLSAAPAFSQASWPDFSQQSWRHSIYSYYGMSTGAGMGGAESPSGSSTGNEGGRYPNPPGTPRNP